MSRRVRRRRLAAAALALTGLLLTAACAGSGSGSGSETAADPAPEGIGPEPTGPAQAPLPSIAPAAAGFDPAELQRIAGRAKRAGSACLLLTRHGKTVGEWYWNDNGPNQPREVFSVTKSITSTLVGIAQDDGLLSVADPASDYIEEWAGTRSAGVTVEDLLSNDSGRRWSFDLDYKRLTLAADRTRFAIGLRQEFRRNRAWAYNNAAIQTLDRVIEQATGQPTYQFAQERLFDPVGMAHTRMTRFGKAGSATYFGLNSTCPDLARFGNLYLQRGTWAGTRVLSADYVAAATGRPSQPLNAAYGYLWWLNRRGPITGALRPLTPGVPPARVGRLVPGAPPDMYVAIGLLSQLVLVDPSSGTVAVRLGDAPPEGVAEFDERALAEVVTAALR